MACVEAAVVEFDWIDNQFFIQRADRPLHQHPANIKNHRLDRSGNLGWGLGQRAPRIWRIANWGRNFTTPEPGLKTSAHNAASPHS